MIQREFRDKGKAKKALVRGLVRALAKKGAVKTTDTRAKLVKHFVDKTVSAAKLDTVAARRCVLSLLGGDEETTGRIFALLPSFKDRTGGFVKIIHLVSRRGDASKQVKLEWVVDLPKSQKLKKLPA